MAADHCTTLRKFMAKLKLSKKSDSVSLELSAMLNMTIVPTTPIVVPAGNNELANRTGSIEMNVKTARASSAADVRLLIVIASACGFSKTKAICKNAMKTAMA